MKNRLLRQMICFMLGMTLLLSGCHDTQDPTVASAETELQSVSQAEQITESSTEQEGIMEYDVIYLNQWMDYQWCSGAVDDFVKLENYQSFRYEEPEDWNQLYAFQAKVWYKSYGENRTVCTDQKQVWKDLCSECGFIPFFPDETNGIPNTDRFYFFATLNQVRSVGTDPKYGFALEIVDVTAEPADRTGGEEPFVHVTVRIPVENWEVPEQLRPAYEEKIERMDVAPYYYGNGHVFEEEQWVKLDPADAEKIERIISRAEWTSYTFDSIDETVVVLNGEWPITYSMSCGCFNDHFGNRSLGISDEEQQEINEIMTKYLGIEIEDLRE